MNTYKRHRFPPDIISYAVWLYFRFNLSHRDIEDLLAEQSIAVSREAIRLWCIKFGGIYTRRLKRKHPGYCDTFYIDEVFVKVNGIEVCGHYGGSVKIIACIEDQDVIDRILAQKARQTCDRCAKYARHSFQPDIEHTSDHGDPVVFGILHRPTPLSGSWLWFKRHHSGFK